MPSLTDYQKQVDVVFEDLETPYWEPLSQFARLAEETGEVGRILNHKYGQKIKKPTEAPDDLEDELGDVLFNVLCLANTQKINLDTAMQKVIDKARNRDKNRYPKKV